jgi:hypothetical protein
MNWQRRLGKKDLPLNDEERRHLGAYKLFLESVDSSYAESNQALDKWPPRGQREIIEAYHRWLEDPEAFKWSQKLGDWIFPFGWLRNAIAKILSRFISLD